MNIHFNSKTSLCLPPISENIVLCKLQKNMKTVAEFIIKLNFLILQIIPSIPVHDTNHEIIHVTPLIRIF